MSFFPGALGQQRRKGLLALVALSVAIVSVALSFAARAQSLDEQIVVPKMSITRSGHTATLLPDGRVLVAGGNFSSTASEIYDPALNQWTAAGNLSTLRSGHTATLLPNGQVIMIGGSSWYGQVQSSVEIFDPTSNRWYPARPLSSPRANHTATLLADGTILVVGGDGKAGATDTAERYDPSDALLGFQHYLSLLTHPAPPPLFPPTFVLFSRRRRRQLERDSRAILRPCGCLARNWVGTARPYGVFRPAGRKNT